MKCNGKHYLKIVYSKHNWDESDDVVRWCINCGAIVVDVDMDNRTISPGEIMKMILPEITINEKMKNHEN